MHSPKTKLIVRLALGLSALLCAACGGAWRSPHAPSSAVAMQPAAAPLASEDDAATQTIHFLEERVRRDPEDFGALNRLAGLYLQRARADDDDAYLELAARAARASLAAVPVERNVGALYALAQYEHATHDFTAARDHAARLIELDSGRSDPHFMLGDALLELGDYERAADTFRKLQREHGSNAETEIRQARLAVLRGEHPQASRHFTNALAFLLDAPVPSRDAVAWCRWQLGETAFASGDYEAAERLYRDALVTHPDYTSALASLARVRAARGDFAGAIDGYERIVRRAPHPEHTAALGDLYKLAGREKEAAAQYALVERVARESEHDNLRLALFYADHDLNAAEAYALATNEYEARRDIYTADAVAWTALKAGKLPEAQAASREALRLGTRDARLFYHAGMVSRAAGDEATARDYLGRALALSPQFDPLQSSIARRALGN